MGYFFVLHATLALQDGVSHPLFLLLLSEEWGKAVCCCCLSLLSLFSRYQPPRNHPYIVYSYLSIYPYLPPLSFFFPLTPGRYRMNQCRPSTPYPTLLLACHVIIPIGHVYATTPPLPGRILRPGFFVLFVCLCLTVASWRDLPEA